MGEGKPSYEELEARLADAAALIKDLKRKCGSHGEPEADIQEPSSLRRNLAILSETMVELNRLASVDEMCLLVAERVFQFNPDAYVGVTLYDKELEAITIRSLLGFGRVLDSVIQILGRDPRKVSYLPEDMTDKEKEIFTSGRLHPVPGGLHAILTRKIPKKMCGALETMLGVDKVYTVGFALGKTPYGGVVVMTRKGIPLRSKVIVEILANQISMAIHWQQALEELQRSESRYRLLADNVTDVIWTMGLDFNFTYVSPSVETLLGYTVEEIYSLSLERVLTEESFASAKAALLEELSPESRSSRNPHRTRTLELEHIRKDGSRVWTEVKTRFLLDREAKPLGILGVSRDITERKEAETEKKNLEENYRQAQKMESVGRLAGGVAHDLNNLLSPILGYGEILLEEYPLNDERRHALEEINRAGLRARDLVRQLLAFGRKQALEFTTVDLNEVVSGFEKLLRKTIREDVNIDINPCPDAVHIRADKGQIEQVILNLAVNAQDAMPGGGRLTIETAVVEPDGEHKALPFASDRPSGRHVMLSISDTGHGMSPDTIEQIFEPFYTTKDVGEGTGLGLATVHGIVKQHSGEIVAHSEPDRGSTFRVYLPLYEEVFPEGEGVPEGPASVPKGSETILLVEDDPQVRNLVQAILKRKGYEVLLAENGAEALEAVARYDRPVHMLLSDVVMPDMNGRDLYDRISKRVPGLKVLYMSGYAKDVITHRGVVDKGVHFIQKPFSVESLAAKVRDVLDDGPSFSAH